MSDLGLQVSFNTGEWAPHLLARVDLAQYRSGAALLENWYVDYRGGASTRPGTRFVNRTRLNFATRLIPFQVSFDVGYVLEFGYGYIRFIYRGSLILESAFSITGASQSNPGTIQVPNNDYVVGDWIFVDNVQGMTDLNDRYFYVSAVQGSTITLATLDKEYFDTRSFGAYTSGGTAQRVYTINSPYTGDELPLIKFTQNVGEMILCHPNHQPYVLSIISVTNWSILPAQFGSTATAPQSPSVASTLDTGPVSYAYGVTALDSNGQESAMSAPATIDNLQDIRTVAGSNQITWSNATGAVAYNVYEATVSYFGSIPNGAQYGFIGTTQGTSFIDSNIAADFSQCPPVPQNPFSGAGVRVVVLTNPGAYTQVPQVTFSGGDPSVPASAVAYLSTQQLSIVANGSGYVLGERVAFPGGILVRVTGINNNGAVTQIRPISNGIINSGTVPPNPLSQTSTSGTGTGLLLSGVWGVDEVVVGNSGSGYDTEPVVNFSPTGATASAFLGQTSAGNPTVPGFFQQRLVLAAPAAAPQTFYMSRPGTDFNFDISSPSQPDDAITGTLVSGTLNTIKAIVSSTSGLLLLTDRASWLVNGGGAGTAVSPTSIVANAQSFVGISDVPPIVANYDILYVQSKGSGVRDLAFNVYFSVFTGEDLSAISSHLFYNHTIVEWAWAEHPYYLVWAVRNDGQLLSLTYVKDQQFKAWAHHTTQGLFRSIATVTETVDGVNNVDAVYVVVNRLINGRSLQYIERLADRAFPNGVVDAWCVDAGIQYVGSPTTAFSGADHLAGATVTGLADGVVIPPFVMPTNGHFNLATAASKVTIGLAYNCKLQTLPLQIDGRDQIQGKVKHLPCVDIRVTDTLGLSIGSDFNHLVPMKDLAIGAVSSMETGTEPQVVTNLVTGDARTYIDPSYNVFGQIAIQQSQPLPATVLAVYPAYAIGDKS